MWEAASGQCVHAQPRLPGPGQELTHCALARAAGLLLSVTADHNLLLYEARSLQLQKQFAGYSEEVLDVRFLGPENSHVVVASNSPCLRVFLLSHYLVIILFLSCSLQLLSENFYFYILLFFFKGHTCSIWKFPG